MRPSTINEPETEQRRTEVRAEAEMIWANAKPAPDRHPFFMLWGVRVDGLKVDANNLLIVPMFDVCRNLQNLSFVGLTERSYLSEDQVSNCYFGIGQQSDTILVAVGFLQGLRAHQRTGHAIAVAFKATNVSNAAKIMRWRHPGKRIAVFARDGSIESVDFDADGADRNAASVVPPELSDETIAARATGLSETVVELLQREAGQALEACLASRANRLIKPESKEAQLLLDWMVRKQLAEVSRTRIMQFGPSFIRPALRAKAALRELVAAGWLATDDDIRYLLTHAALATFRGEQSASGTTATAANNRARK